MFRYCSNPQCDIIDHVTIKTVEFHVLVDRIRQGKIGMVVNDEESCIMFEMFLACYRL
jgi:hypothetical protein